MKRKQKVKMTFAEWYKIATIWTGPIFVGLALISTVSALNQSQSLHDANIVFDPTPDWSSCCDYEMQGPSKIPGVDFLTYQVNACEETEEELGTLLPHSLSSLPRLSKVEMCANMDGNFNLNFILSLSLEDIVEGRLSDVQVIFSAKPGVGSNGGYLQPVCHQFSFAVNRSLLSMVSVVDKVYIPNSCLARHLDEGMFTLQVRRLPSLHHIDYQLAWAFFYDYSEVGIWDQLLVGVAPIPTANQIAVVFQPPKTENLVDGLQVELLTFPEQLVNWSVIPSSQTSFIFHHVKRGRYWVKVTPLSALCNIDDDVCTSLLSPEVLMIELEQPSGQPGERPIITADDKGLGRKLGTGKLAGAVVAILVLVAVLSSVVIWFTNQRRRKSHIPTLHMIGPTLSPLEIKAVQQMAIALSSSLGIPVTLMWRDATIHGDQSYNDQIVLRVRPDSDSNDCQEREERNPCPQNVTNKDITAIVAFSRSQAIRSGNDFEDVIENPTLLNIIAGISFKSYQKIIFILFTEQTQLRIPKLYFSLSQGSAKSNWDEIQNDSEYQLTLPLRPSKGKSQKGSDILSVCPPQKSCFQKMLSSCNTFCVPDKTQQLYTHLKARVSKLNPGHKFPSADDTANNEKWTAANTVAAQIVLRGQSLSYEEAFSYYPGTCLTIDEVSLCNPKDDFKLENSLADFYICPPRDKVADSEILDFNSECDSFSNFSEVRRNLFS